MNRGQAEALAPMIARVMSRAAVSFSALDRIALSIGPGTFTGLRTGLATARGLRLASNIPVVGVGTLQALAWDQEAFSKPQKMPSMPLAIALDARRGQVYWQLFASPLKPLCEPKVLAVPDAVTVFPEGKFTLAGSGADLLMEAAQLRKTDVQIQQLANENGPSPLAIAVLAARQDVEKNPPSPLYLRPPDAKPQNHVPLARQ